MSPKIESVITNTLLECEAWWTKYNDPANGNLRKAIYINRIFGSIKALRRFNNEPIRIQDKRKIDQFYKRCIKHFTENDRNAFPAQADEGPFDDMYGIGGPIDAEDMP